MRPSDLLGFSFSFFLVACTSLAPRFKGSVFLHDQIPPELCTPELEAYGIYRKLYNGDFEVASYCSPVIKEFVGVYSEEFELMEEEDAKE